MREIKVDPKDTPLLFIGVLLALFFQIFYEMIHELFDSYHLPWYDCFLFLAFISGIVAIVLINFLAILREKNKKSEKDS